MQLPRRNAETTFFRSDSPFGRLRLLAAPALLLLLLTAAACTNSPEFFGKSEPLPEAVKERMRGSVWRPGCPVSLEELSIVTVSHIDMEGRTLVGEIIVHRAIAAETLAIFRDLHHANFPINSLFPIRLFEGDDKRSMRLNNSSAFNCREITGRPGRFSKHSYGVAIDLNPRQNPYLRDGKIEPFAGRLYADRTIVRSGMLGENGAARNAFVRRDWTWGGDWLTLSDYQHFQKDLPLLFGADAYP